jgi:hypothetical protein
MCSVISAARDLVERLHDVVSIPRNNALDVYSNNDLPRYTAMCRAHLPGYDGLSAHCKGVLFTLVLNCGASFDVPETRYAEMRGIKAAIRRGDLARVLDTLRAVAERYESDPDTLNAIRHFAKGSRNDKDPEAPNVGAATDAAHHPGIAIRRR